MDTATLDAAIFKHAQWKHFLRESVKTGKSEWTVAAVGRDDQCEFGEWLALLPQSEKKGDHWPEVKRLHTEFHTAAAQVLESALAGRQTEATESLAIGGHFSKISSELVVALSAWKKAAGS